MLLNDASDFVGHQKFGRLVCNELLRVCRTWELNNQPVIEEPMPAEVFVHAIKNTRRKMEDKHVILPIFGKLFQGLVSTNLSYSSAKLYNSLSSGLLFLFFPGPGKSWKMVFSLWKFWNVM